MSAADVEDRYLLDLEDVAKAVSLGRSTVETLIRDGELRAKYVGRKPLVTPSAIQEWIDALPGEKPQR
jgi:excisionase family DNA binding protein